MFKIVFGLIQLFVGIYGLAGALKMRNKHIVSGEFFPPVVNRRSCRDIDGLIRFLFKRQFAFSIYCAANGVLTILDGQHGILQGGLDITCALVFIVMAYLFSSVIRKAVKTYF